MSLKTEHLQHQLTRSEEWGKNADVKIGVILAFDGVIMLTVAKHALKGVFNIANPHYLTVGYIAVLVLLCWSVGKALWGITPRLKHRQGQGSPLYYYDIKDLTLADYKHQISGLTTAKYRAELIHQLHAMAKVVSRKMNCFRDSVLLLAASLVIMGGLEVCQRLTSLLKV